MKKTAARGSIQEAILDGSATGGFSSHRTVLFGVEVSVREWVIRIESGLEHSSSQQQNSARLKYGELLKALANLIDSPVVGETLGGAENCWQGELGGHFLAPVETVRKAIVEEFVWRQGGVGVQAASVAATDMVEDVPSW